MAKIGSKSMRLSYPQTSHKQGKVESHHPTDSEDIRVGLADQLAYRAKGDQGHFLPERWGGASPPPSNNDRECR